MPPFRIYRPPTAQLYRKFSEAAKDIASGDLILYRRWGAIAIAGRGIHSHAAKAAWWNCVLMQLEMRSGGGRATSLEHQVRRRPGRIDIFEVNPENRFPEYNRLRAVYEMVQLMGKPYGYRGLLTAALYHLPIMRWFVRPDMDDQHIDHRPPFCSHAVAMADRFGGVDPVPNLGDRVTEPADLARSQFYKYRFTLVP